MTTQNPFDEDSSRLNVGHLEIDRQHAEIFSRAAGVTNMIGSGGRFEEISAAYRDVLSRVSDHFAYEEALMASHGYPHLERHRLDHQRLQNEGMQLLEALCAREPDVNKFYEWWRGWSVMHVLREDHEFGLFLESAR